MNRKGFTLVELIIVIAIVAILAGAIFVAIDPARRLHETRNARRSSDVSTILDAIKKHQADNNGDYHANVAAVNDGDIWQIGTAGTGCDRDCAGDSTEDACVDLSGLGANYLATVPEDPKTGSATTTGYALHLEDEGTVKVIACDAEGEGAGGGGVAPDISIKR